MQFSPEQTKEVAEQTKHLVDFFHGVLLPALALLGTGIAKTVLDRIQNRTHERRSVQLTNRISELEQAIATLPKRDSSSMKITSERVLSDELEQTIAELRYLQTREHYSFHRFCSDISFRTRRTLLLYRPRGFAGFLLHSAFYGWIVLMLLIAAVIAIPSTPESETPQAAAVATGDNAADTASAETAQPPAIHTTVPTSKQDTAAKDLSKVGSLVGEILALMLMFSVMSIPAWILRHFALKRLDKLEKTPSAFEQTREREIPAAGGASGI